MSLLLYVAIAITYRVSSVLAAVEKTDLSTLVHVHVVSLLFLVSSDLLSLVQVWRHGDRTPVAIMPTDVSNNASSWSDGLGEITTVGLAQQYRLGALIRRRYDGFLSKRYSPFEIYVRAS